MHQEDNDKQPEIAAAEEKAEAARLAKEEKQIEKEAKKRVAERLEELENRLNWRNAGLCQYCGGKLKGLFNKRCVDCGTLKDYM